MNLSKEVLEKNLSSFFSIIKPEGVIKIDFKLISDTPNRFHLRLIYVVPDDSRYMKVKKRNEDPRYEWNRVILYSIRDYFNVLVLIDSTSIMSESFYKETTKK